MTRHTFLRPVLFAGLIALSPAAAPAQTTDAAAAQEHVHGTAPADVNDHGAEAQTQASHAMMEGCHAMMARKQETYARFDALVEKMNAAAGDARTQIMAELVALAIEQRSMVACHMSAGEMSCPMMGAGDKTSRN